MFCRARSVMSGIARRPRRSVIVALLIVLIIAGAGAGFLLSHISHPASKVTADQTAALGSGEIFTEGDIGSPRTLNPLLASSPIEQDLVPLLFSSLVRVDGSGEPRPALAESWAVTNHGLTYTVKLRSGADWQDGQPITAADVLFTVRLIQSPDFSANTALADFWRGITVSAYNSDTVTFQLIQPLSPFPTYLTFPVLPKHILGDVVAGDLATDSFAENPIGSGPYQLASWDRANGTVTLTPNVHYFGPRPRLTTFRIRYYANQDELLSAIRNGEIDGSGSLSVASLVNPKTLPSDYRIYSAAVPGYTALFFNTQVAPLDQSNVRRAIGMAIDKSSIVQNALAGYATVGTGPVPASSWAYTASPTDGYDPHAARSLLSRSGWEIQNGKLIKDGSQFNLPIIVNNDDPLRVLAAQQIAQQLEGIGINVTLSPMSSADVSRALTAGQFTAAIFGWRSTTGDPDSSELWNSSGSSNGQDFTGLHDADIDQQLNQARTTSNMAERRSLYQAFQQTFQKDSPAIILYYPRYLYVVRDRIHGVEALPVVNAADRFDQITGWYGNTAGPPTPDTGG